jgi:hypothetical protein
MALNNRKGKVCFFGRGFTKQKFEFMIQNLAASELDLEVKLIALCA